MALAIALTVAVPVFATAGEDFQLWTELGLEAPLGADFRAGVRHESRFVEDASRFGLHNYDVGIAWVRGEQLAVALHFLEELERADGRFRAESRPYVDALVRETLRGVEVSNRTRVELRLREDRETLVRLRDRVQLLLPWALGSQGPRPFVSEEVLFESDGRGFDQNRVMFGLVARRRALTVTGYGMLLSQERHGWVHAPVFGLAFTWSLAGRPMMSGEP